MSNWSGNRNKRMKRRGRREKRIVIVLGIEVDRDRCVTGRR